jgi:hypothetical protein
MNYFNNKYELNWIESSFYEQSQILLCNYCTEPLTQRSMYFSHLKTVANTILLYYIKALNCVFMRLEPQLFGGQDNTNKHLFEITKIVYRRLPQGCFLAPTIFILLLDVFFNLTFRLFCFLFFDYRI